MAEYRDKVRGLTKKLEHFEIEQIPRSENQQADALARLASSSLNDSPRVVKWELLPFRSIDRTARTATVLVLDRSPEWMKPLLAYLKGGELPSDPKEAKKVEKRAEWFTLVDGELYNKGYVHSYLKCIDPTEGKYILKEIHFGDCGGHIGARATASKALRAGFFWPTMQTDATELIKHCDKCQRFGPISKRPPTQLKPISTPLPFARWGLDILGPFSKSFSRKKLSDLRLIKQ